MNNHDSPPRPVIALDFDGTICQNAYPDIGEPNWHVIEKAKQCQEQGAYLILWTCRGGQMLEKAVAACTEWGLTFDAINENLPEWREAYGTDPRKIGATEYWDDRSVIADGTCVLRSSRCAADHAEWEARKMLGAILTIAVLVAIGVFGYLLCWKAGEADDRAEQEQIERMNRKEEHK